jgi:hypothetical protein
MRTLPKPVASFELTSACAGRASNFDLNDGRVKAKNLAVVNDVIAATQRRLGVNARPTAEGIGEYADDNEQKQDGLRAFFHGEPQIEYEYGQRVLFILFLKKYNNVK